MLSRQERQYIEEGIRMDLRTDGRPRWDGFSRARLWWRRAVCAHGSRCRLGCSRAATRLGMSSGPQSLRRASFRTRTDHRVCGWAVLIFWSASRWPSWSPLRRHPSREGSRYRSLQGGARPGWGWRCLSPFHVDCLCCGCPVVLGTLLGRGLTRV